MKKLTFGNHVVDWIAKRTNEFGNFGAATGIGQLVKYDSPIGDGWKLCAGVAYAEWNGVNVVCHIASEGRNWADRRYLSTIFDYPFNQLKCNRITVCIGEGNYESRNLVEHMGFTREANLQGAHPTGDLLVYKMFRGSCRYLEKPYAAFAPLRASLVRAAA